MRTVRRIALSAAAAAGLLVVGVGVGQAAAAVAPGPGYLVESISSPTVFLPGQENTYKLTVTNSGSLASNGTPITVLDTVPAGMTVTSVQGESGKETVGLSCTPEGSTARCVDDSVLPAGEELAIYVNVAVEPGVLGMVTNAVQVLGGGAGTADVQSFQNSVGTPEVAGLTAFHFTVTGANGARDTQAGDHPSGAASSFQFATLPPAGEEAAPCSPSRMSLSIYRRGSWATPRSHAVQRAPARTVSSRNPSGSIGVHEVPGEQRGGHG